MNLVAFGFGGMGPFPPTPAMDEISAGDEEAGVLHERWLPEFVHLQSEGKS